MMLSFKLLEKELFFIAGPCVIEPDGSLNETAAFLAGLKKKYGLTIIFKASFDKANRTSLHAFRGPGIEKGLQALSDVKEKYQLPIITDIHEVHQARIAAEVVDIIQIPAFLCRQTDLLIAAAKTGKIINIKKAQFLSGMDMQYPLQKVIDSGNREVMLTERGNMFGYNNLVVDFRNIVDMKTFGFPVIMDVTHSVQKPGGAGDKSGGDRKYVPMLAKAAKAVGADGFFLEIHPDPDKASSDGPNMLDFEGFEKVVMDIQI